MIAKNSVASGAGKCQGNAHTAMQTMTEEFGVMKDAKELKSQLETMCRRCINHEMCQGTGCQPKKDLADMIERDKGDVLVEILEALNQRKEKWNNEAALYDMPLTEIRHEHITGVWRGLSMAIDVVRDKGKI